MTRSSRTALSCATRSRSSTPTARRWAQEDDRTRHIETLQAHTGPAFLTYRDDRAIDEIVAAACRNEPLYDFVADDGIGHTVWEIAPASSCMADELQELFARIPVAYIADGHHRSAAAARYAESHGFAGESRWFMAVIFPASQLKILAYNRLVADYPRSSAANRRITAAHLFEPTGHRSAPSGPT